MRQKLLLILALFSASYGWGQSLLVDDFTGLTTSSNLATQSSWTKGGSGPDATVQNSGPINYAGYNGGNNEYVLIPSASATTSRVYKGFTTTTVNTGTIYTSFLLNLSAATATGDYFITLGDASGGTNYFLRLFAKTNSTGFNLGFSKNSATGSYAASPTLLNFGVTYLIVMAYTGVTGTSNDLAYLWINPSLSSEPSTSSAEVSVTSGTDLTSFGQFVWHNRSANNPVGKFDGVRVAYGTTSATAWTNLAAQNTSALTLSTSQTLSNVTIPTNTNLIVNPGVALTLTNTIVNNGTLTLKSDATGSASLTSTSIIPSGNVTVQQWITGQRGYRVLSNPFSTALTPSTVGTANGITITGTNDVKTYTSSSNTWSGSVSSIPANTPYAVFIRGLASEVTGLTYTAGPTAFAYGVTGTLNGSSVSITPNASGFTLVGNPFAAPVNSSALTNGTGKSYYVYNAAQGSTDARVKAGGWSSVLTSSATTPIPMMGVIAYQAGSAATYNVSATDINTTNSATTGLFGEEAALKYLELQINKGGNFHDKLYVRADANASEAGNESIDLAKLNNDVTNIYTIAPDKTQLAVDARKGIDASIPIGITAPAGSYTFTVANNNLPNVNNVYLLDKLTNTKTVLTPGATYSFDITADAASKGDSRFELGAVKTQIQDVVINDNFSAKVLGNVVNSAVTLQVKGAKSAVQITVTDLQGKLISSATSSKEINTLSLLGGSGMYIIKVTDGDNSIVNKVVKP